MRLETTPRRCLGHTAMLIASLLAVACLTATPPASAQVQRHAAATALVAEAADAPGVLITGQTGYGYLFQVTKPGTLSEIRANFAMHASLRPSVPVMAFLHEAVDGKIKTRPLGHLQGDLHELTPIDSATALYPNQDIRLQPGVDYWLVTESPTGAEFYWAETDVPAERYRRQVLTGEESYDRGPRGRFAVMLIAEEPPKPAEASSDMAEAPKTGEQARKDAT